MTVDTSIMVIAVAGVNLAALAGAFLVGRRSVRRRKAMVKANGSGLGRAEAFAQLLEKAEAEQTPKKAASTSSGQAPSRQAKPKPEPVMEAKVTPGEAKLADDLARWRRKQAPDPSTSSGQAGSGQAEPKPAAKPKAKAKVKAVPKRKTPPKPASPSAGPFEKALVLDPQAKPRRIHSDEELLAEVKTVLETHANGKKLGHRRVHSILYEGGLRVSRNRVLKVMREDGLLAAPARRSPKPEPPKPPAPSKPTGLDIHIPVETFSDPEKSRQALAGLMRQFADRAGLDLGEVS